MKLSGLTKVMSQSLDHFWFLEHDSEFTDLIWTQQNIMKVQLTNPVRFPASVEQNLLVESGQKSIFMFA